MEGAHVQPMDTGVVAVTVVGLVADGAADADLEDARTFDESRFEDVADDRAVVMALLGESLRRIGVSVELDQRQARVTPCRQWARSRWTSIGIASTCSR